MSDSLQAIVRDGLVELGYELVEFRRGGTRSRPLLDVRVDRLDGEAVTVDDCARASRGLEARLEASEAVPERYVLEVSSPGVERPLSTAAHWRRFIGQQASVKSDRLGGRAEFRIEALEGEEGSEEAVLVDAKGVVHRVPLAEIGEARLAFHWKR